ncbi:hypothetical protein BDZ94DRAFT_1034667 [Collybia nuda]|uniref:Uncharacterized protein n=1 Tax=Collybia nuda TaxID=64659 RepID=A0A9P5YEW1_9AGAR|nr:hypothetical protein BDZ94DRAFT_1034667 [Collybia nuda]
MRPTIIPAILVSLAMVQSVASATGFTIWHSINLGINGEPMDLYLAARRSCDNNCNALFKTRVQSVTNPHQPPGNSAEVKEMEIDSLCNGPALRLIRNGRGANVYRRDNGQQVGWCNPSSAGNVPCFGPLGATNFWSVWDCDSYICQC